MRADFLYKSNRALRSINRCSNTGQRTVPCPTQLVIQNAHKAGIWAGICGELGADTTLTKTFLQMGIDELSVSPGCILPVRKVIREME